MLTLVTVGLLWTSGQESAEAFISPRAAEIRILPSSSMPCSLSSLQRLSTTTYRNHQRSKTALFIDVWSAHNNNNNNNNTNYPLTFSERELTVEDVIVILLPAVLTGLAFSFYEQTSASFHNLVDSLSSNTWQAVDGGAYLSDLLIPALNGPVVTFISLLFGSLSSMTLSNLYSRQVTLANKLTKLVEDIRLLDLHLSYLPAEYQRQSRASLRRYADEMKQTLKGEEISHQEEMELRWETRREEIELVMSILHEVSAIPGQDTVNGRVLDEAYGTLNRIIDHRSDMAAVYDLQFPVWHYGNLALLAFAICTVFFILTDRSALIFLGALQLRTCWAMLVGTISVLFCVIYDLNTPLQGMMSITTTTTTTTDWFANHFSCLFSDTFFTLCLFGTV
jgi:hypothetical protein